MASGTTRFPRTHKIEAIIYQQALNPIYSRGREVMAQGFDLDGIFRVRRQYWSIGKAAKSLDGS